MFTPSKKNKLNILYRRKPVIEYIYDGTYSKEEILNHAKRVQRGFNRKGVKGKLSIVADYDVGIRSGYFFDIATEEPVSMYQEYGNEETEEFEGFRMYFINEGTTRGGRSNFKNDCLWDCLEYGLHKHNPFKTPEELKQFLKLSRNEPIDISLMKLVEAKIQTKKFDCRIVVTGDHTYNSSIVSQRELCICLIDGHYSINNERTGYHLKVNYKEKQPLIIDSDNNCFDGSKHFKLSYDEYQTHKRKFISSPYILINKTQQNQTFEETYNEFITQANTLKEASNGEINLYKTGTYKMTALNYFNRFTKFYKPDELDQIEADWIYKASIGAMIWANKGYKGAGYKYDYVSMYPSILDNSYFLIPYKKGNFIQMSQEEFDGLKFYKYGIYRAIIEGNTDYRLFKTNSNTYYTHIDLNRAKDLKYTVKLVQDDQPNCLIYNRENLINSHFIFHDFVQNIFKMKRDGIVGAKRILNVLWGALSQRDVISVKAFENGDIVDIGDNKTMSFITPIKDGHAVRFVKNDKIYQTSWARCSPFLLAKGRSIISTLIQPHIDNIVRIHTDGLISKVELPIKVGTELGDVKFEGFTESCVIKHVNSIEF